MTGYSRVPLSRESFKRREPFVGGKGFWFAEKEERQKDEKAIAWVLRSLEKGGRSLEISQKEISFGRGKGVTECDRKGEDDDTSRGFWE